MHISLFFHSVASFYIPCALCHISEPVSTQSLRGDRGGDTGGCVSVPRAGTRGAASPCLAVPPSCRNREGVRCERPSGEVNLAGEHMSVLTEHQPGKAGPSPGRRGLPRRPCVHGPARPGFCPGLSVGGGRLRCDWRPVGWHTTQLCCACPTHSPPLGSASPP